MWRTPSGERVLRGCEWNLFREGLSLLWDEVEESIDDPELCVTGIGVFDRLEPASKLALMALVGTALHDEGEACPELTALSEGTFAAVYAVIRQWIDLEIDAAREDAASISDSDNTSMRTLVLAAFREVELRSDDHGPDSDVRDEDDAASRTTSVLTAVSEDSEAWVDLIEELLDQVLWGDRDFLDEDHMLDLDPDFGRGLKSFMGIDDEYFTATAPEPSCDGLVPIRETLRKLCGRGERGYNQEAQ